MRQTSTVDRRSTVFFAVTDRRALAALVIAHVAMVAIVMPRGDFPLNDDWAYAHGVGWLLSEGRIRLSDWVGMNLLPQTLAGAATVWLFGPGFETLRHVTQAAALAAMAAAYAWFRAAGLDARSAFVLDAQGVIRYSKAYAPGTIPESAELLEQLKKI